MSVSAISKKVISSDSSARPALTFPKAADLAIEELWIKRRAMITQVRRIHEGTVRKIGDYGAYEAAAGPILRDAWAMETDFEKLPHSLNKLGALLLISLEDSELFAWSTPDQPDDKVTRRLIAQLTTLKQFLTGTVSDDVRDLLERPDRRIGDLACIFP